MRLALILLALMRLALMLLALMRLASSTRAVSGYGLDWNPGHNACRPTAFNGWKLRERSVWFSGLGTATPLKPNGGLH